MSEIKKESIVSPTLIGGAVVVAASIAGLCGIEVTATLFLTSCATTRCDCPAWPTAGKAVAQELERLDVNDYPAVWEWLARLEKLRSQLQ